MTTSNRGIELIKAHEGFRPRAYLCPAGVWTIGYGHTGGVKSGDVITADQGESFLRSDISSAERVVVAAGLRLTQNQFDALVSFVFNVGAGNFNRSTLLRLAKANVNDPAIAAEFAKWNKATVNGVLKVLPGLTRRRAEEADLYFYK
jgi:lysozyme